MSIKQLFRYLLGSSIITTLTLLFSVWQVLGNQQALIQSADARFESYKLGQEASSSSSELTRLARMYVITEDDIHKKDYWDLVNHKRKKIQR